MVVLPSPIQISGEAPDIPNTAGESRDSISISTIAASFQTLYNSFPNWRSLNNYGNIVNGVINK
jgi:hypothetical protein